MGIIKPRKRRKDPDISENAIMIMPKTVLNRFVSSLDVKDYGELDSCLYRFYVGPKRIAICGPFLGAPQAVLGLEKLIALGAKKIWVLSWCGSINKDVHIGDIVIPTHAFSEEGTSQHYPLDFEPLPDKTMISKLKEELSSQKIPFFEGPLLTIDAPYRETEEKIKEYQKKGALGIDMEISALIRVANFRAVSIAGIFVVSDELFSGKWKPGFSSPKLKDASSKAIELIFKLSIKE